MFLECSQLQWNTFSVFMPFLRQKKEDTTTMEAVLILNVRLPSSVYDRTLVFDLMHADLGKDDILFPFLKSREKKKAVSVFQRLFS